MREYNQILNNEHSASKITHKLNIHFKIHNIHRKLKLSKIDFRIENHPTDFHRIGLGGPDRDDKLKFTTTKVV